MAMVLMKDDGDLGKNDSCRTENRWKSLKSTLLFLPSPFMSTVTVSLFLYTIAYSTVNGLSIELASLFQKCSIFLLYDVAEWQIQKFRKPYKYVCVYIHKWPNFISFYGCSITLYIYASLLYLFIFWWTIGLFPCLGWCK